MMNILSTLNEFELPIIEALSTSFHLEVWKIASASLNLPFIFLTLTGLYLNKYRDLNTWLGLVIGISVIAVLKNTIKRTRPFVDLPNDHPMKKDSKTNDQIADDLKVKPDASFPSGHAFASSFIMMRPSKQGPGSRVLVMIWATAVIMSRPAQALHYPSDVISGIVLAALVNGMVE